MGKSNSGVQCLTSPKVQIYSHQIAADGRLNYKHPYFHLHLPLSGTESHADGMCTSAEGWLLSATEAGIQICDQPGRVNLILPKPGLGRRVCYVRLHANTLYAATDDAVWNARSKSPPPSHLNRR